MASPHIHKKVSAARELGTLKCKVSEGYFRFLCPLCSEFITATNPKTNLARCFRCEKNFNPIDMTMLVNRWNFRETVEYLEALIIPKR